MLPPVRDEGTVNGRIRARLLTLPPVGFSPPLSSFGSLRGSVLLLEQRGCGIQTREQEEVNSRENGKKFQEPGA